MTLEETVISSIISIVGGFFLGLYTQRWNMKRSSHESTKERVYSPLFDEIEELLANLKENNPLFSGPTQWYKVAKEQHLGYLIEPVDLRQEVYKFYDQTLPSVQNQIIGIRKRYGEFVKEDLNNKVKLVPITGFADPKTAIEEVATGVSWSLPKGEVWFGDEPKYTQTYDRLKSNTFVELPKTFLDYFNDWKQKSKNEGPLVEYRNILKQAVDEAGTLRRRLAKKLGVKSDLSPSSK